jgi:hypothetical protein
LSEVIDYSLSEQYLSDLAEVSNSCEDPLTGVMSGSFLEENKKRKKQIIYQPSILLKQK